MIVNVENMMKILDKNNTEYDKIWYLDKKHKKRIVKCINKAKHIRVCTFWYDGMESPNVCNWIDVEGIGYGWIWCKNKLVEKSKFLQKCCIKKYAKNILKSYSKNDNCFRNIDGDDKNISFYLIDNSEHYIEITVSDFELYF